MRLTKVALFLTILLVAFGSPLEAQTADESVSEDQVREKVRENPFPRRIRAPDFPRGTEWLNVGGPLRMGDLKGKFVILDFWTYCCINCIHILPELKKLEEAFPNELVVIGVHSAKFETEKGTKNIEEAILRYEIEHPVINDANHRVWTMFGASSWPTVYLLDPEGNAVWGTNGEIRFEQVEPILRAGVEYYRAKKLLDETPIRFELLSHSQKATPLRFPGKVLADASTDRLYISDSNHNRIVISTLDGKLIETIGSGVAGADDGGFGLASFDHPQGMALVGSTLYVADTENHLLRKVDLESRAVTTIAGTGIQARQAWPGIEELQAGDPLPERWIGPPASTALNSPWALWARQQDLYIAMAGTHQIWKMPLDESEIGPYAGNGREDIVDGPLVPKQPYQLGYSSLAQPSGLASDENWLYVADSEGSSIRAVPFDPDLEVRTVVGSADLPGGRLFTFGDVDGKREDVLLQHALGVVHHEGRLFITDTYNNKVKVVDAATGDTRTLAGTLEPGSLDEPAAFDEPSGITYARGKVFVADTNNHAIRTIELATGEVSTLSIAGLEPPALPQTAARPDFRLAEVIELDPVKVQSVDKAIELDVRLVLPEGWKVNSLAPANYWLDAEAEVGPVTREKLGKRTLDKPAPQFKVSLPVSRDGPDKLSLSMTYYYCQEGGEGLCRIGSVVWKIPVEIASDVDQKSILLFHEVK